MLTWIAKTCDRIVELSVYCLVFIIPFSKTGVEICATVAIAAWIVKQVTIYKLEAARYFPQSALTVPLFALFTVYFISAVFSTDIGLSLKGLFFKMAEYILIFFLCADIFSNREKGSRRLIIFLRTIMLSAALLFIDAGIQWVRGRDLIRGYKLGGLKACFNSSNGFAGYIIAVLPVLFCAYFLRSKRAKFYGIKTIGIVGMSLYLIGLMMLFKATSRGAWLGYLISMLFLAVTVWFMGRNKIKMTKRITLSTILCILIPLIMVGIFAKPARERIVSIRAGLAASIPRIFLWKEAIAIIEDFPILGAGPNTYSKIIPRYSLSKITGTYPHNCYLQIAAEVGISGLAVFLWFLWRFFYNALRSMRLRVPRDEDEGNLQILLLGIMAGISAMAVHGFFDTTFFMLQLSALFWAMLGAGAACILLSKGAP